MKKISSAIICLFLFGAVLVSTTPTIKAQFIAPGNFGNSLNDKENTLKTNTNTQLSISNKNNNNDLDDHLNELNKDELKELKLKLWTQKILQGLPFIVITISILFLLIFLSIKLIKQAKKRFAKTNRKN